MEKLFHHHYQLSGAILLFFVILSLGDHELMVCGENNHELMVMGQNTTGEVEEFQVGVVIDANTSLAKVWLTCMDMALSDFYASHKNYKTRLVLHVMDSKNDVLDASSAGMVSLTLPPIHHVTALHLIQNVKVQAIIGPTTSAQAVNIAHLGKRYQVPIISFSATSPSISLAQNPYFIRTSINESSQVNAIAAIVKKFGWREVVPLYEDTEYGHGVIPYLMDAFQNINTRVPYRSVFPSEATDDQITQELNKLDKMQTRVLILHMLSPLGLRIFNKAIVLGMMSKGYAWIITSGLGTELNSFEPSDIDTMQGVFGKSTQISKRKLDILGIWAYDTIWAMVSAVENHQNSKRYCKNGSSTVARFIKLQIRKMPFKCNICGSGFRDIGIWKPSDGTNKKQFTPCHLAQGCQDIPKGWEIPLKDRKLRIGVPIKDGFNELVKTTNNSCNGTRYDVVVMLPYFVPHEFIPYKKNESGKAGSYYDDLVHQVQVQNFDVVVGDVTITNRSQDVDFTLPYTEGGVSMIVLVKKDLSQDTWVFLKPLELKLWVTTGAFFLLVVNREFRGGPHSMYQWGTMLSFSFSMLGRFVMGIWLFVVLILTQSYTANLASMLTIQRSDPTYNDVNKLIGHGYNVGYQEGSFSNLEKLQIPREFDEAFLKGRSEGGIVAAESYFLLNSSLQNIAIKYMMVGDIYPYDGFGFNNLKHKEEGRTEDFKKRWFKGERKSCDEDKGPMVRQIVFSWKSFWILFLITGICSALAIIVFLSVFVYENKQILIDPSISTRNKILNLLRKFCEHDENRLITYFEHPACSDQKSYYTTLGADYNIASGNRTSADGNTRTDVAFSTP
ncbi:hypothetical protein MKW92_007099 [Papaver armeniacum]|nr:hypothetical protein MKW92_007099 [Papaver armeniacum]